jgi:hypothetical protein
MAKYLALLELKLIRHAEILSVAATPERMG